MYMSVETHPAQWVSLYNTWACLNPRRRGSLIVHVLILQIQDANGVYGVALIAPSVTPYGHMNPSFRLFTMDADTYQLLEYQQYHLNLTKANGEARIWPIHPFFEVVNAYKPAAHFLIYPHVLLILESWHVTNIFGHLELASRNITPEFELIYNTTEEYGLKDLSPEAYADLVERWATAIECRL